MKAWTFIGPVLILRLLSTSVLGQTPLSLSPSPEYSRGTGDAEKDARNNMTWELSGCLYAPLSLLTRYSKSPALLTDRLIGRSADYLLGYVDSYRESRGSLGAGFGWAGFTIVTVCAAVLRFTDNFVFWIDQILK